MRVLISAPYLIPELPRFGPILEEAGLEVLVAQVHERLSEEEILGYAGEFDAAVCGDDRFTAEVLERCSPPLRVISKWGTGIDSIDLQAAERLAVTVRNTPDAFTDPVADSVMGYILAFARGQPWMDRSMKQGAWTKRPALALRECSLGVVGVGRIGKAVLQRARAFGMRLLGNDVTQVDPAFLSRFSVRMMGLRELLQSSDFVSLNCDLNPTSHHLIGEAEFIEMRPSSYLINTSRGAVIDQEALIWALEKDAIAGAGLDVFEEEPLEGDSPLLQLDNTLLAPHNANSSPAAWERVHWNTIRNLLEGLGYEEALIRDLLEGQAPPDRAPGRDSGEGTGRRP